MCICIFQSLLLVCTTGAPLFTRAGQLEGEFLISSAAARKSFIIIRKLVNGRRQGWGMESVGLLACRPRV